MGSLLSPFSLMEKSHVQKSSILSKASLALYGVAAAAAASLGIASTFAVDYNMAGPAFTANLVTGAKGGLGDSVATIQTTLDNSFLIETALLFLGLAVVIGVVMFVIKGHRRI